jgi:hypothetical protein
MAGNINDFVSRLTYGARANLFRVNIDFSGEFADLEFFAKGAQIPGRTISPIPVKYLNNTINYPGDTTFTEWSLQIMNDEGFTVRKALEAWMRGIKQNDATASTLFNGDWYSSAVVTALGPNMETLREYNFYHMFPSDLGTIDLSFDSADTLQEYSATFTFSYWEEK